MLQLLCWSNIIWRLNSGEARSNLISKAWWKVCSVIIHKRLWLQSISFPHLIHVECMRLCAKILFPKYISNSLKIHALKMRLTLWSTQYWGGPHLGGNILSQILSPRKKIDTGWMEVLLRLQGGAGGRGPIHHYIGEMFSYKSFLYFSFTIFLSFTFTTYSPAKCFLIDILLCHNHM